VTSEPPRSCEPDSWHKGVGCIRRIILYGSLARGTASPESDFDLLIIETDPVSMREEMQRLGRAVHDLPYPVDVRVMGEQEFEETKNIIDGLAYPAHKYGVVLYENASAGAVGLHPAAVDALTQPMEVREEALEYGESADGWETNA
jgi:predicted nucleotidyltransferase